MISIVIPVYNNTKYLKACLDSIVNQTYGDFECLIVDDGSTAEAASYYDSICPDGRFKIYHKLNGGVSSARNYGLDRIKGEFLCFVDSDDIVDNQYLEKLHDYILKYDADMVQCGLSRFCTTPSNDCGQVHNSYVLSGEDAFKEIGGTCWNKMFKSSKIGNNRFDESCDMFEDIKFIFGLVESVHKCVFTDEVLYFYRVVPTGLLLTGSCKKYNDGISVTDYLLDYPAKIYPVLEEGFRVFKSSYHYSYCTWLVSARPSGWKEIFEKQRLLFIEYSNNEISGSILKKMLANHPLCFSFVDGIVGKVKSLMIGNSISNRLLLYIRRKLGIEKH